MRRLLFFLLLATPAVAQWSPGPAAFGSFHWAPPVADFAGLPTSGTLGEVRLALTGGLYFWDGNSWELVASGGGGGGGGGEVNTASNRGGGLANFDSKSGVDLRFNSFAAADFDLAGNVVSVDDSRWARDAEVPLTLPPSGSAGGGLAGAYPNPTIAADAVPLGTATTGPYVSGATLAGFLSLAGTEGATLGLQDCGALEIPKRNASDTAWECAPDSTGAAAGDVVGPASALDNAAVRFAGTTGKVVEESAVLFTDPGGITTGTVTGSGNHSLQLRTAYNGSAKALSVYNNGEGETAYVDGNGTWNLLDKPMLWKDGNFSKVQVAGMGGDKGVAFASDLGVKWSSTTSATGAPDIRLTRGGAGMLAVQDYLRLTPLAAPPAVCNSSTEGAMYYRTGGTFCACNGTAWSAMLGPGPCSP